MRTKLVESHAGEGEFAEAEVEVQDSEHEGLSGRFRYVFRRDDKRGALVLVAVMITGRREDESPSAARVVSAADIRRLPVARWERAAKMAVDSDRFDAIRDALPASRPQQVGDVLALGRTGMKRAGAAQRLARIAAVYRELVADGVRNPAVALAEREGVAPATARSLVHRARRAGLLPPINEH